MPNTLLHTSNLDAILSAVRVLRDELKPQLVSATPQERRRLVKFGDASVGFVQNAVKNGRSLSAIIPACVDIDHMSDIVNEVNMLGTIQTELAEINEALNDTIMIRGSEAMKVALAIYNGAKLAARMKVPGSRKAVADMSARFSRTVKSSANDELAVETEDSV